MDKQTLLKQNAALGVDANGVPTGDKAPKPNVEAHPNLVSENGVQRFKDEQPPHGGTFERDEAGKLHELEEVPDEAAGKDEHGRWKKFKHVRKASGDAQAAAKAAAVSQRPPPPAANVAADAKADQA